MSYELEKEYLSRLPDNPLSLLEDEDLDKALYLAREDLSIYHKRHIKPRIVVMQAIYNIESSAGEYEALRRQGVSSFSTKRGSVSFGSSGASDKVVSYSAISPQVKEIIGDPPSPAGRLY